MSTNYKSRYQSLAFAISYELKCLRHGLMDLKNERNNYSSDALVGLYTGMISEREQTIKLLERWERAINKEEKE